MHAFRVVAFLLLGSSLWAASDLRQIGMVNLPGAPGFGQMAFANGLLVMTQTGASAVDVFDPARRRVVAQITGLQSPRGIAVDENAGKVYVADHGANSIAVINMDGWKVSDSIPLQGSPDTLLLNSGKLYWTDAESGTVALVDVGTKQTVSSVNTGGTPRDLAFDPGRNLIFVTVQDLHQVIAIDPQTKIVNRFTLNASQPTGLVFDSHSGELYVAVRYAVLAINASSGVEVNRVSAPAGVDALWLDPGSRVLYAASEGSLLTIHANGRLTPVDEITTQVKGHTVAYDAAKHLVLLPGGREGKSRILILRPMDSTQQPGSNDDTRADVR
ncbi:MAG: YncE family protein [Candidatus Korobacteraceae bacterium]